MEETNQRISLGKRSHRWSWKNRLGRVLWRVVWPLCGMWGPRCLTRWRCLLIRCFGGRVGYGVLICPRVKILMPWNVELDRGAVIAEGVELYNFAPVVIGRRTVVSQDSYLCTGTHDHTHPHYPLVCRPITIGAECWITARVLIAPGVRIGDGTVVAMGSVVVKDLPEWHVAGGNPCRVLKERVIRSLDEIAAETRGSVATPDQNADDDGR